MWKCGCLVIMLSVLSVDSREFSAVSHADGALLSIVHQQCHRNEEILTCHFLWLLQQKTSQELERTTKWLKMLKSWDKYKNSDKVRASLSLFITSLLLHHIFHHFSCQILHSTFLSSSPPSFLPCFSPLIVTHVRESCSVSLKGV